MKKYDSWWVQDKEVVFEKMLQNKFTVDTLNLHYELLSELNLTNYDTALDIGSHIGIWSNVLASTFNHVHAFEPSASNCECFLKNTEKFDNITLHNVAIFEHTYELPFIGSNSLASIEMMEDENHGSFRISKYDNTSNNIVEIKEIDEYDFDNVDLIQLHTKGSEYMCLLGAEFTIKKYKPIIIYQIYENQLKYFNVSLNKIENLFDKLNYKTMISNKFEQWNVTYRIAIPN